MKFFSKRKPVDLYPRCGKPRKPDGYRKRNGLWLPGVPGLAMVAPLGLFQPVGDACCSCDGVACSSCSGTGANAPQEFLVAIDSVGEPDLYCTNCTVLNDTFVVAWVGACLWAYELGTLLDCTNDGTHPGYEFHYLAVIVSNVAGWTTLAVVMYKELPDPGDPWPTASIFWHKMFAGLPDCTAWDEEALTPYWQYTAFCVDYGTPRPGNCQVTAL